VIGAGGHRDRRQVPDQAVVELALLLLGAHGAARVVLVLANLRTARHAMICRTLFWIAGSSASASSSCGWAQ
jgi:hypothetical protein